VCMIPILPANSPIPLHRLSASPSNIRISADSNAVSVPTPFSRSI
jgi:hypothetical protein